MRSNTQMSNQNGIGKYMNVSDKIRRLGLMLCALACPAASYGQEHRYQGDVTDVRVPPWWPDLPAL